MKFPLRTATGGRRSHSRGVMRCLKIAATALLTGALLVGTTAIAGELDHIHYFHINAQPLDKALLQFGTQAHVQLSVSLDATNGAHVTRKLKGRYTGTQALAVLLSGTQLRYTLHGLTVEIGQLAGTRDSSPASHSPIPHVMHRITPSAPSLDPPPDDPTTAWKSTSNGSLQEIIVTAQKYRQPELDVPMSLVVIGSQQLQMEQIKNLNDLQYYVPGLRVQGGGSQQRITIRGVGNTVGNGAYVSEYINDADMTSSGYSGAAGFGGADLETYDLARVEVLRGPQGTLYGDGALGGTIRLITNQPVLGRFAMNSEVALPFTEYGSPSEHVEAMINAPVASALALRVAGEFNHDGGWIDEPAGNLLNFNSSNLTDARIEGLWRANGTLHVHLMQIVHRESYGLSEGEDANGNFQPLFNSTYVPTADKNFDLSNVEVTLDFSRMRAISSSSYMNSDETLRNFTENEAGVIGVLEPGVRDSDRRFTEELRLASAGSGPFRWLMGGFYDHDRSGLLQGVEYIGLYAIPTTLASISSAVHYPGSSLLQGSTSWAAFGNASYTFASKLSFGAGVRYYTDREQESATGYQVCPCNASFSSTDPRAYIAYKLSPNINTYISASKGFRTGGFNSNVAHPYGPESLWNYEMGSKMRLAHGRVLANADVFLSNYSQYVVFAVLPAVSPIFGEDYNIGTARIKGAEGDITWRVTSGWLLTATGDYVDAKIRSIVSSALRATYKVGDDVPLSSKYQFSASVERDFRLKRKRAYARVDYSELGPQINYQPLEHSDVIRMLNFEAGVQWHKELSIGLFAKNLLNDRGLLDPWASLGIASRPRPRTYGVDFKMAFAGR